MIRVSGVLANTGGVLSMGDEYLTQQLGTLVGYPCQ